METIKRAVFGNLRLWVLLGAAAIVARILLGAVEFANKV